MAIAELGQARLQAALEDLTRGRARKRRAERRAEQAERGGERRAGGLEHRAAAFDVAHDVVEIDRRQDAAPAVAVEDDEVEILELDLEQLADRERDQRQLANRRAVLLLGWAQDGEMHQVDRRIGLQEVAPDALARMRLARHQQHAEPLADAIDLDDAPVVDLGQFAAAGLDRKLDDVGPGMVDVERHLDLAPDRRVDEPLVLAVAIDGEPRRLAGSALVDDLDAQLGLLSDQRVVGHVLDH